MQIVENSNYEMKEKECNELRMRSGCIIIPEEDRDQTPIDLETPPVHTPSIVTDTEIK